MTRKDFQVVAEILAQVSWAQECLGASVEDNRGAIDTYLEKTNTNYNGTKFWEAVEKAKLELKGLTS